MLSFFIALFVNSTSFDQLAAYGLCVFFQEGLLLLYGFETTLYMVRISCMFYKS